MNFPAIIFSDLDGTLLDHETYSFSAALPALEQIRALEVPLILCSSKTASEIIPLQDALGIDQPFIAENGAGVYLKGEDGEWFCKPFAVDREAILSTLETLREAGFSFSGFNDWGPEGIAARTGLSSEAAHQAAEREFSEPLTWEDSDEARAHFISELEKQGMIAAQGGRFLTIAGRSDKGAAMKWLITSLCGDRPAPIIALGDSPNDLTMLNSADTAVVVRSGRSESLQISGPRTTIRTHKRGPSGWTEALLPILEELTTQQNTHRE